MAWWIIRHHAPASGGACRHSATDPLWAEIKPPPAGPETKATRYLPAAVIPLAAVPTHQESSSNQRNTRWHGPRAGLLMRWWTTCSTQSRALSQWSGDLANAPSTYGFRRALCPGLVVAPRLKSVTKVKHYNRRPMSSRSHRNSGDAVGEAGTDYDAVDRRQVEPAVSMQIAESPQHVCVPGVASALWSAISWTQAAPQKLLEVCMIDGIAAIANVRWVVAMMIMDC